jgi:hypothetical protein
MSDFATIILAIIAISPVWAIIYLKYLSIVNKNRAEMTMQLLEAITRAVSLAEKIIKPDTDIFGSSMQDWRLRALTSAINYENFISRARGDYCGDFDPVEDAKPMKIKVEPRIFESYCENTVNTELDRCSQDI